MVYSAHRPDSTALIENDILTIRSPYLDFEIDATTGALIRMVGRNDEADTETTISVVQGGYDTIARPIRDRASSFPDRYDEVKPISSLLEFVLEQAQRQPFAENLDASARILQFVGIVRESATVEHLLSQLEEKLLESQAGKSESSAAAPKFALSASTPGKDDSIYQVVKTHAIYYVPGLADELFPRGSWPWTMTREIAFFCLADGSADERTEHWNRMVGELSRLERAEELSPIACRCWIGLTCRGKPNRLFDTLGTRVAQCGLRQSTDENIRRDIELLVTGDNNWARLVRKLLDEFAGLPQEEQRRLTALFPAGCAAALTAHAERRASQPQEPAADALREEMFNLWTNGLRERVEGQLRIHAGNVALKATASEQPSKQ